MQKQPTNGFKPGKSGNPAGKPKGARNHATRLVLGLMEDGAQEVVQVILDAAKQGDLAAAKLVIERIAPPMRERPLQIDLPAVDTAAGINAAQSMIVKAVGTGELLPGEGTALATMLDNKRKAIETEEMERRISELEAHATAKRK